VGNKEACKLLASSPKKRDEGELKLTGAPDPVPFLRTEISFSSFEIELSHMKLTSRKDRVKRDVEAGKDSRRLAWRGTKQSLVSRSLIP
jgi:hypothetical protein